MVVGIVIAIIGLAVLAEDLADRFRPRGEHHTAHEMLARARPGARHIGLGRLGRRLARDDRDQFVEARHPGQCRVILCHAVQPRQMREQQAAIEAPARADLLAAIEDDFLDALHRALGQNLLGLLARQQHRRGPALRKGRIAPPLDIGRLRRAPAARRADPNIAEFGEQDEELRAQLGRPAVAAGDGEGCA